MILSKPSWHAQRGLCALLLLAAYAFAQGEAVPTRRAVQLREAPGDASRVMSNLPLQTAAPAASGENAK